ncbi:type I polyketide synthase, partial [Streptacidiphilus carbonis]|uniref:type I polyketide synthase n=1 Tax=Streptacidiphilus carbonis TaxID=105422 RepID=UPI0005AA8B19
AFIELGPDPVLTAMVRTVLGAGEAPAEEPVAAPLLRKGHPEARTFTAALAQVYVRGVTVRWSAALPGGRTVDLPTYPYQRESYWLDAPAAPAAPTPGRHPLLDDAVELAGDQGWLFTGRLDPRLHPWLAEHAIMGSPLLPGAAVAELALHAARRTGAQQVAELTLERPLTLEESAEIQLMVGAPGVDGSRTLALYSRPDGAADAPWVRHAGGLLAAMVPADPADLSVWPPAEATEVPVDGLYSRLADRGYLYGAAFQGLRAVWQHGTDLYAEVRLPEGTADAQGFALHPAALDAALHATLAGTGTGDRLLVPFSWSGLALHGSGATGLRVRLSRGEGDSYRLLVADATGTPVFTADELAVRELPADIGDPVQAGPAHGATLLDLHWSEPHGSGPARSGPWAVLGRPGDDLADAVRATGVQVRTYPDADGLRRAVDEGAPVPVVVLAAATAGVGTVHAALGLAQGWAADERFADSRLAVLTEGAAGPGGDERPDPASAAVWGLIRSAQAEHPGRFTLADADGRPDSLRALVQALASDQPQLAVRAGRVLAPALRRHRPAAGADPVAAPFDADSHVLITGGLGTLGRLVARHLVDHYGVRQLLLTGRRGPATPGAEQFAAELESSGAGVTVAACDTGDRAALADLLAALPAGRPLTAVVHTAGVLDDAVLAGLSAERLDRVLRPKAEAAVHLDELTRDLDLTAFVLFSSLAGTLGSAGQGNYAAANAFLDALAQRRRAEGRPALSLAWGLWAAESAMTGDLGAADLTRMARSGITALSAEEGLALFDAALATGSPALAAAALDLRQADADTVPAVLRGLAGAPRRAAAAGGAGTAAGLRAGLDRAPRHEHRHLLLEAVRTQVAAVLGHADADRVPADRRFQDLGFDSLTAVELRNRLTAATGVKLPPTLIFDHPTPGALADRLRAALVPDTEPGSEPGGTPDGTGEENPLDAMNADELVRLVLGATTS